MLTEQKNAVVNLSPSRYFFQIYHIHVLALSLFFKVCIVRFFWFGLFFLVSFSIYLVFNLHFFVQIVSEITLKQNKVVFLISGQCKLTLLST